MLFPSEVVHSSHTVHNFANSTKPTPLLYRRRWTAERSNARRLDSLVGQGQDLLTQAARFTRLEFFLSWWAYSFPLAAITVGTLQMFEITGLVGFALLGWLFLGLLTLVVTFLLYRTFKAIGENRVCVPDE